MKNIVRITQPDANRGRAPVKLLRILFVLVGACAVGLGLYEFHGDTREENTMSRTEVMQAGVTPAATSDHFQP